jgi:hypothetical protein
MAAATDLESRTMLLFDRQNVLSVRQHLVLLGTVDPSAQSFAVRTSTGAASLEKQAVLDSSPKWADDPNRLAVALPRV